MGYPINDPKYTPVESEESKITPEITTRNILWHLPGAIFAMLVTVIVFIFVVIVLTTLFYGIGYGASYLIEENVDSQKLDFAMIISRTALGIGTAGVIAFSCLCVGGCLYVIGDQIWLLAKRNAHIEAGLVSPVKHSTQKV
jgi:hypothetical protein